jgi:hypothetical protein
MTGGAGIRAVNGQVMDRLNAGLGPGIQFSMTVITAGILDNIMQCDKVMGRMTVGAHDRVLGVDKILHLAPWTAVTCGAGTVTVGIRIMHRFNECQVAGAVKGRMAGGTARGFRNGMDIVKYMGIMAVGTL